MTTATDQPTTADVIDPRTLIDPDLLDKLAARVARVHQLPQAYADRIMVQTLAFLYACAHNPGAGLTPSPDVDLGWHAFILDTHAYAEWCQRIAGRLLHHYPEEPGGDQAAFVGRLGDTMQAMRRLGLPVDPELWLTPAECSQCYAGCVDDPAPIGGTR